MYMAERRCIAMYQNPTWLFCVLGSLLASIESSRITGNSEPNLLSLASPDACPQYVPRSVHSKTKTEDGRGGCKCKGYAEKVFCGTNREPYLGRKFVISKKNPCMGNMYCAVTAQTTTSTTGGMSDFECGIFVRGSVHAVDAVSDVVKCRCADLQEQVYCGSELRPVFQDQNFELPRSKAWCEGHLYCAMKSQGAPDAKFAKGDFVFYRDKDGRKTTSQILKVQDDVYPPHYTISSGGIERQVQENSLEALVPLPSSPDKPIIEATATTATTTTTITSIRPTTTITTTTTITKASESTTTTTMTITTTTTITKATETTTSTLTTMATSALAAKFTCLEGQGPAGKSYRESKANSFESCGSYCNLEPECESFDFTTDAKSGHLRLHDGSGWVHDACRLYKVASRRDSSGLTNVFIV
eukprot:TRINITY_DN9116_c0_g1_i1.p1 TRINITY_DN9116_c0_g1~~TRINITY_DN9116_c0_g1_i1.p1  ORF type:complete len:415 (-),score=40.26 TRINITY_DN9116_c0_g1_i1:87-1331(-)